MLDLAFDTDAGIGTQANFGLIVLQTDETIEMEMRRFLDIEGVALYQSRIPSGAEVTPETLSNMQHEIEQSVSLLPPAIDFDVIGYGCTSAASVIGESAIEALVQRNRPNAQVTNPITATKAALKALGAKRIGFVSPYIAEVSASLRGTLEQAGYEIVAAGSFNEASDTTVARMTEASILKAIIQVAEAAPSDAIFVSCTNLRVANIIAKAEAQLGIPVLSSNQAMAWHMLKLASIEHPVQGYGQLFNH